MFASARAREISRRYARTHARTFSDGWLTELTGLAVVCRQLKLSTVCNVRGRIFCDFADEQRRRRRRRRGDIWLVFRTFAFAWARCVCVCVCVWQRNFPHGTQSSRLPACLACACAWLAGLNVEQNRFFCFFFSCASPRCTADFALVCTIARRRRPSHTLSHTHGIASSYIMC